jgi:hypothetical protein
MDVIYAPPDPIHEIHVFDSLNVLGVGGDFENIGVEMIRTSDGGLSWEYEQIGMLGIAWDLDFRNEYEAWSTLVTEEKLIYSLDSGQTWTQVSTPDNAVILDMIFPDSLHGFAVGREGAIIKYKPPVISVVNAHNFSIPEDYAVVQNYPNPFNPSTIIKYSIPTDGFVKLAVYNLLGEEVALLVSTQQKGGRYEVEFNASSLVSGTYIYRIESNNFVAAKKLMLLK